MILAMLDHGDDGNDNYDGNLLDVGEEQGSAQAIL